jgi:hypothetical protein
MSSDLTAQIAASRGWISAADALSELWWESHDEMAAGFSFAEGQA